VLEILFQFVYPRIHPDLRENDFETVTGVAEASEKYHVYAAMNICQLRIFFLPAAVGLLNFLLMPSNMGTMVSSTRSFPTWLAGLYVTMVPKICYLAALWHGYIFLIIAF